MAAERAALEAELTRLRAETAKEKAWGGETKKGGAGSASAPLKELKENRPALAPIAYSRPHVLHAGCRRAFARPSA